MDLLTTAQVTTPQTPGGGSLMVFVLPMVFMLAVFYFLLIRPQRKQDKQRREMLKDLQKNDKIVTIGGIHGVVANVRKEDDIVTLKIDESGNVRVRVSRSSISRILGSGEEEGGE